MGNPYAPPGEGSRGQQPASPDDREPGGGGHWAGDRPAAGDEAARPGVYGPTGGPAGWQTPQGHAPWPTGAGGPTDGPWPQGPPPGHDHPSGAGDPGNEPPGRKQPSPEVARATSRRVLHFLALLLAAVVTSALPLPWQVGSILFVLAAIVVGIRAFVLAWRSGVRGGLAVMLGIGVGVAGFVALGMLSLLALWPQQVERQECLARAVTISATRACEAEFQRAVEERLSGTARPAAG